MSQARSTSAPRRTILADELAAEPSDTLVVDLDQVSFFTSLGLTALALAQRDARERGIDLRGRDHEGDAAAHDITG